MPALAPQAGAWLAAVPCDPGTTLSPEHMHLALRRLRLPLSLTQRRSGGDGQPGCGREGDVLGDHRVSCARSGLLARRALAVEQAWVRVAREAVSPEGRVVPQQWLSRTTAPGVSPDDRRRLDLVVHGATERGKTLCCDATLASPVRSDGRPHAGAADRALSTAERRKRTRYPELGQPGPQCLVVLAAEVGGHWHAAGPTGCPRARQAGSISPLTILICTPVKFQFLLHF